MKSTFLFFVLACISAHSFAQTSSIQGIVSEAGNNEPVPFAKIVLETENDSLLLGCVSDPDGIYQFNSIPPGTYRIVVNNMGYQKFAEIVSIAADSILRKDIHLTSEQIYIEEVKVVSLSSVTLNSVPGVKGSRVRKFARKGYSPDFSGGEEYGHQSENAFVSIVAEPLSTFGVDVDKASYSNVRRHINQGSLPPADAVRIEEMINYFDYDYPAPAAGAPFSVTTEYTVCPWNPLHGLVHIGVKAKEINMTEAPANNLVFLIDVSGSMQTDDKLPLLKSGLYMLIDQLRPEDKVAIVVYAGAAGLVLPSTGGSQKTQIKSVIEQLEAGGSTAGGEGIELAYKVALEQFVPEGNNRIILATDGDFNVGISDNNRLFKLIEEKRKSGVFLSILGLGSGNLKDYRMEQLADKGDGNYSYIDNELEAKKVLVTEMGGTLLTVAKDVKIQAEFNPQHVKGYRLIGYENRMLEAEDFDNDAKDAGDMGSGHSVTVLYEIIPVGSDEDIPVPDSIPKKNRKERKAATSVFDNELMKIKFRYKEPGALNSTLLTQDVPSDFTQFASCSENFRFAAAVASFGMLLRNSPLKGNATFEDVLHWAEKASSTDPNGYRAEFAELVKKAILLTR